MKNALSLVVLATLCAGAAAAQDAGRPNPLDPRAQVPPVGYRSAFEGYRPFAAQELRDWRSSNDEVGAAGGHAGLRPAPGAGDQGGKPQAPKPESARPQSGHGAHHGAHK